MTGLSAYDKKYGTEAEREARREAQAKARAKVLAERESLERDEEKQLMEVIKASLELASTVPVSACLVCFVLLVTFVFLSHSPLRSHAEVVLFFSHFE